MFKISYETFTGGKVVEVIVERYGYADMGEDRNFMRLIFGDQGSPKETLVNTRRVISIEAVK